MTVHISEIADAYVKDINAYLKVNDKVKVKVLAMTRTERSSLSIRQAEALKIFRPADIDWSKELGGQRSGSFESPFQVHEGERRASGGYQAQPGIKKRCVIPEGSGNSINLTFDI